LQEIKATSERQPPGEERAVAAHLDAADEAVPLPVARNVPRIGENLTRRSERFELIPDRESAHLLRD
jgi:hypothetical protein